MTRKNKNGESDLPLTIASQYGLIDQRDFFNKVVAAKDMSNYYLLKKGEFAYNKSYSNGFDYGSIKRLNAYEQGCLSTLYICFGITSDDIESDYLECYFDTLKWYGDVSQICAEGARNHGLLNVDTKAFFDEVTIEMPSSEEEQKKISAYLNNLDNLITLHHRKYTFSFIKIKRVPSPDISIIFTNAWEQRKVKELCSISTGKSNTQDKVDDGEYPFYVRSPIIERSAKYLYNEEAVLTVGDGVGTGKVFHYVNGKYDLHQRCYRMYDFTDELNARYFYHTFSLLFYNRVMAMTAKTSVDSVRMEMIADMEIPVPRIDEQKRIGAFFTDLDNLITLHQCKPLFLMKRRLFTYVK